ncbi:hypothetical protein RiCNE_07980 [Rickettsia endosymbiont of Culicoides newsteadi]|nr:hypothetical protein RiCNE_07980 [Rickettsia endosymbiont of Culicoides newsteadi]
MMTGCRFISHCEETVRSTKQSRKVTKDGLPRPLRGLAMTENLSKTRLPSNFQQLWFRPRTEAGVTLRVSRGGIL